MIGYRVIPYKGLNLIPKLHAQFVLILYFIFKKIKKYVNVRYIDLSVWFPQMEQKHGQYSG